MKAPRQAQGFCVLSLVLLFFLSPIILFAQPIGSLPESGPCANGSIDCLDCNQVPNGNATLDSCGVCNGNNACLDCNNEPNGSHQEDGFGNCCLAQEQDACGKCFGGEAETPPCGCVNGIADVSCFDCNGIPQGTWVINDCGECSATTDCSRTPDNCILEVRGKIHGAAAKRTMGGEQMLDGFTEHSCVDQWIKDGIQDAFNYLDPISGFQKPDNFDVYLSHLYSQPEMWGILPGDDNFSLAGLDSNIWNDKEKGYVRWFLFSLDEFIYARLPFTGDWRSINPDTPTDIFWVDKDCKGYKEKPVGPECSAALKISAIDSPLSLLWGSESELEDSFSLVKFPVNPAHAGNWFTWHGSKTSPLLVYDPAHTGVINSATQLFGHWTFGQRTASLAPLSIPSNPHAKIWESGYQALGSLDLNADGKVSGNEAAALALWFDNNQDGVSQKGEVKTLNEVKVTALYYQPSYTDSETHAIYATRGYERNVNGETSYGTSVDWFSENSTAKSTLGIASAFNSLNSKQPLQKKVIEKTLGEEPLSLNEKHNPLRGPWVWELSKQLEGSSNHSGMFLFDLKRQNLRGVSLTEILLKENPQEVRSAVMQSTINGTVAIESDGTFSIQFDTKDGHGGGSTTSAKLGPDRKKMYGISTSYLPDTKDNNARSFTYSWIATRPQLR